MSNGLFPLSGGTLDWAAMNLCAQYLLKCLFFKPLGGDTKQWNCRTPVYSTKASLGFWSWWGSWMQGEMRCLFPALPCLWSHCGSGGWLCGKWLSSQNLASCSAAGKWSHKTARKRHSGGINNLHGSTFTCVWLTRQVCGLTYRKAEAKR